MPSQNCLNSLNLLCIGKFIAVPCGKAHNERQKVWHQWRSQLFVSISMSLFKTCIHDLETS